MLVDSAPASSAMLPRDESTAPPNWGDLLRSGFRPTTKRHQRKTLADRALSSSTSTMRPATSKRRANGSTSASSASGCGRSRVAPELPVAGSHGGGASRYRVGILGRRRPLQGHGYRFGPMESDAAESIARTVTRPGVCEVDRPRLSGRIGPERGALGTDPHPPALAGRPHSDPGMSDRSGGISSTPLRVEAHPCSGPVLAASRAERAATAHHRG